MPFVIQDVPVVVIGGVAPYTGAVVNDAQNTFLAVGGTASFQGTNPWTPPQTGDLHLDATLVTPGVYKVHVRVTDSATPTHNVTDELISVVVADPNILTILNDDQDFQPGVFPAVFSLPLNAFGGVAPYSWSIVQSITTLPNPTIDNSNNLHFTLTTFGTFVIGLTVVDSVGKSASKVVTYSIQNSVLFALVDGQLEVVVTVPDTAVGTHHFTAKVQDSSVPPVITSSTLYYTALEAYSAIQIKPFAFDHDWGTGDTTKIVIPIAGLNSLQGYSLGSPTIVQPTNGLAVTVDNVNNVSIVEGPPASFQNSQERIPLPILHGTTQVALVSREFTLLSHSGTTDIGNVLVFPRPYIVGEFVGLNPQKPSFNSPSVTKNVNYTVRVQTGSVLPAGLSLDSVSGLIYGNLAGTSPATSVVEYIDNSGLVHGTVTIQWKLLQSQFTLIDNLTPAKLQQPYTGVINTNSSAPLASVSIVYGILPAGLTASLDPSKTFVQVTGVPLESGYFDIWWLVTNVNNQQAFLRSRFTANYIEPLTILTSFLPTFSNQPYSIELQGFGGVTPYVWSLDPSSPVLPGGFSLSSAGVLAGTYTNAPNPFSQNLIIDLADAEVPALTTSAILNLTYDNTLKITTPAIPIIVPGQNYTFGMTATGGNPPYTWSVITGPPLDGTHPPTGIVFNGSGNFSGVTNQTSFSASVTIQVQDSAAHVAQKTYTLQIGTPSGLNIDTADVGPITRGVPYQGHMSVFGPGTAPYAWQIPPASPHTLPVGLILTADANTQGVTSTISGTYNGPVITNLPVEVEVVDANGQSAFAYVLLSTSSNVIITNTSLPAGVINGSYSVQLTASGGVPPYTFSLDPSSPLLPPGYTITSGGLLSGVTTAAYNKNVTFDVQDSLSPANTGNRTYNLLVQATALNITNTSPLPAATSGRPYTTTLTATGSSNTPFVWSISPSTTQQLPPGITLNGSTGVISGTTSVVGSFAVTFRVTDTIGAFTEKQLTLPVSSGLSVQSGITFTNGIGFWLPTHAFSLGTFLIDANGNVQKVTTGGTSGATAPAWNTSGTTNDGSVVWTFQGPQYIGYIDNGSVTAIATRPNDSFFVVATGVVSTQSSQLTVSVGSTAVAGITATVVSIVSGVAQIQLNGPFAQAALGDSVVTVTVTDSGVQTSASFKWKVFNSGALRLAPGSGTFPVQVTG